MDKKEILHAILLEIRYWIEHADLSNSESRIDCLNRCMSLSCFLSINVLNSRLETDKGQLLDDIIHKAIFGTTLSEELNS